MRKILITFLVCTYGASCSNMHETISRLEAENVCLRTIHSAGVIDLSAFRTFRISAPSKKWGAFVLFHSPSESGMGSLASHAAAPRYHLSNIVIDKNKLTADGRLVDLLLSTNQARDVSIVFLANTFNRMEKLDEDYIPTFNGTVTIKTF